MKYLLAPGLALLAAVLLVGCATPKGATREEQRNHVLTMKDETLAKLYAEKPETREMVRKAAGYAVFSNIGTHIFLLSTGNGYGVVVDNATGKKTHMKMNTVGAGLGAGTEEGFLDKSPLSLQMLYFICKGSARRAPAFSTIPMIPKFSSSATFRYSA